MKTLIFIIILSAIAFPTVLGDLAASMQPGQWRELNTNGLTQQLLWAEQSYHYITQYSDGAVWNPATEEFMYVGGGHAGVGKHIVYSTATNTWREETQQGWMESLGHGYDHNAIDPVHGIMYHHPMSGRKVIYKYLIPHKTWMVCTYIPDAIAEWSFIDCCRGVSYFPERKELLITSGRSNALFVFGTFTGQWTKHTGLTMSDPHTFAKYNPVHKCVLFGGGNGSSALYKLDTAGQVTSCAASPFYLGVATTVQVNDPVTGKFLVFHENGQLYEYDVPTNSWNSKGGTVPFHSIGPDGRIFGTVAAPVSTYGVTMYLTYNATKPRVHIYKMAEMPQAVEAPVMKTGRLELSAFPNPFNGSTMVRVNGIQETGVRSQNLSLQIYDSRGRMVSILSPVSCLLTPSFRWDASANAPGVYLLKLRAGNRTLTKKLLLQK